MIPIPGTKAPKYLLDNVGSADVAELAALPTRRAAATPDPH
ncbi:hypothetical protein ACWY4P_01475 [Streptomyces sp. LZ34]